MYINVVFCLLHRWVAKTNSWNEVIKLPIRYKDLPLSSQLIFTVYDYAGPPAATSAEPVGGTTLRLFGKKCTLKKGKQRCLLWPDNEADAHVNTTTPSKIQGEAKDERGRLEKVSGAVETLAFLRDVTNHNIDVSSCRSWRSRNARIYLPSTGSTSWLSARLSGYTL